MKKLDLSKIISVPFSDSQYVKEEYKKEQVVIHHSAGWDNARGMFDGWSRDKQRVATCVGVSDNGQIYQAFSSKYYAWHIGAGKTELEKKSIGIEICNWGQIVEVGGKYYSWVGAEVKKEKVIKYDKAFKTYSNSNFFASKGVVNKPCYLYERYTDEEVESVRQLLVFWNESYGISKIYNPDMWDVSQKALSGQNGIWTHVSYRKDKTDCHPQPELIQMLKSL